LKTFISIMPSLMMLSSICIPMTCPNTTRLDCPAGIWIVHDRSDIVDRLHHGQIVSELVDRGIVSGLRAHEDPRVTEGG
jgi:hypothetical protein